MKLTTHIHLVPRLIICGVTPPLHHASSWRGVLITTGAIFRWIFGPKREEDRSWIKLHNDELHSLYYSPNIVRVIKSRRMRWVGHVARMG
jgi:hypothetical protein